MRYTPRAAPAPVSELARAAEAYAEAGWWIFPIKPLDKKPLTAHGLQDASNKASTVREWWRKWPDANIGLNCGKSGIVAVDLDFKTSAGEILKDGLAAWAELATAHGLSEATRASRTANGGRHLLFLAPSDQDIPNSADKLAVGIDVRGKGGYIVLPPSTLSENRAYAWEDPEAPLQPLPEPLIELLTAPVAPEDPWKIYTLHDAHAPRPPLVWLVDKVVPMGSLNIWFGAPGSLKSMILADLAIAVASGLAWLPSPHLGGGFRTVQRGVLWLDFDNGVRRTHERFQALSRAHGVGLDAPLYYVSMPDPYLDASDSAAMGALAQRVVDRNVGLVIIDNLGLITGLVDENTAQMQEPMKGLRWLTEATGAALNVIHHQRKTNGTNVRAGETLRGHSSIESALDLAVHVQRDDLHITVASTKDRGMRVDPFGAAFSYENDASHELVSARFLPAEPDAAENQEQLDLEKSIVEYLTKHPNLSATQIYNHLGGNRKNLFDTLRTMRDLGQLSEKQGPGTSRLLYVP